MTAPLPAVLSTEGLTGTRTTRGNVTFTDLPDGNTRVDVLLRGAPNGRAAAQITDVQWEQHWASGDFMSAVTLHGGATVAGMMRSSGSEYAGPIWNIVVPDEEPFSGSINPTTDNVIVADCAALAPSGTNVLGPFYNIPGAANQTGYFQTCGPDAYVNISFTIPRVKFAAGTGAVTVTPVE